MKTSIAKNTRFASAAGPLRDKNAVIGMFERVAVTSPESAAGTIVSGIRKGKRRILVGPDAHLVDAVQRLAPVLHQRIIPPVWRL